VKKIFAVSAIVVVLLFVVLIMPLPFIAPLWQNNIARHRMTMSVSRNVTGLHRDDVVQKLGHSSSSSREGIAYPMRGMSWRHFIVLFDGDGFVRNIAFGNPAHFGMGG